MVPSHESSSLPLISPLVCCSLILAGCV